MVTRVCVIPEERHPLHVDHGRTERLQRRRERAHPGCSPFRNHRQDPHAAVVYGALACGRDDRDPCRPGQFVAKTPRVISDAVSRRRYPRGEQHPMRGAATRRRRRHCSRRQIPRLGRRDPGCGGHGHVRRDRHTNTNEKEKAFASNCRSLDSATVEPAQTAGRRLARINRTASTATELRLTIAPARTDVGS